MIRFDLQHRQVIVDDKSRLRSRVTPSDACTAPAQFYYEAVSISAPQTAARRGAKAKVSAKRLTMKIRRAGTSG